MPVNPTDDPLKQIRQNQDLVLYNEGCKELQVCIKFFCPIKKQRDREQQDVTLEKVAKEYDTS